MQQQPAGYGSSPQWYGQPQQSPPPSEQWNQQPYTPYPPQQGFVPQQPFPPQQGQFQQPFPNPQFSQQPKQEQPPPEPQQVNKRVPFYVGLIAALVLIACAVGFAILGRVTSSTNSYSTLSEPDYKASTTDTTVANIDKDSNQDKGKNVHFTATILNFVKDSNGNTAGANVDNGVSSGIIQVIFPSGTDLSKLNTGDTIEVWGVDEGSFSGTNAFGATIQEVGVGAAYMTDQTTGYQTA